MPESTNTEQAAPAGGAFRPGDDKDVLETVAWAISEATPLEVLGQGTKRKIGRPTQCRQAIDLTGLSGVTLYEPEELVLSAKAGTPVEEVHNLLAEHNQELAFEPMDYGPLLGTERGGGTLGGVLATNLSGPRRVKAGAARDHILGVNVVSGRGETFKSGGRVVKNVTGYDLSKLMAGSWGTLGIVTDLTFKVLPSAETEKTVVLRGLDDETAASVMAKAMGSSAEVSGAAHLPESVTDRVAAGALAGEASTLLRIDGFEKSVDYRARRLSALLDSHQSSEILPQALSRSIWADIRDVSPFADGTERPVWRVSMTPTRAFRMVADLRLQAGASAFYDWQGGLVWLRMESDAEAPTLRALLARHGGGHATLVRADNATRSATEVFEPQAPALEALSARLKEQFDPSGVLNPGRIVAGR